MCIFYFYLNLIFYTPKFVALIFEVDYTASLALNRCEICDRISLPVELIAVYCICDGAWLIIMLTHPSNDKIVVNT